MMPEAMRNRDGQVFNPISRAECRELQDRALYAIERLFPHDESLESRFTFLNGPTVAETRQYIYPNLKWLWEEWIDKGIEAGHDLRKS